MKTTMALTINPAVFREYDIRGIAGLDLSDAFAEQLGLAYMEFLASRQPPGRRTPLRIAVGEDCRLSSPQYGKALISGLIAGGARVLRLGNCPTPTTYFSLFHFDLDGAIMVTASHLPADHNGFKICIGKDAIYGEQIQDLRRIMEKGPSQSPAGFGEVADSPLIEIYLEYLRKITPAITKKKVVIDCGNGNGSQVVPQIFKSIGAEVIELYCVLDGRFPNHVPDPSVAANNADLILAVREHRADFGIAIDGDADRLGIVDETGKIVYGDDLLVIFSRDILKTHPGATVVSEVKASFRLYDDIAKHGGHAIMWKTGHSLIEAKMKETKALVGGEMSGHLFFADRYFGYDDAVYAALRIYEIAAGHTGPISSLLNGLPSTIATPEIRIPCDDAEKFNLIEKTKGVLERKFAHTQVSDATTQVKINTIDGIRIDFGDGWGLMRASNTEAVLSLRFEAVNQLRLNEIRKIFDDALAIGRNGDELSLALQMAQTT
jgi:phosphomannomutase/phosphoglucomutase